ncbi:hypothetical protein Y1Q_0001385 [Alligator mississippiensis]|uniref:Uncharacterized protein n=1 Tax=Alligator mississippiensis TaxID=8496 RepID=A0A151M9D1_ALLMI|nr:hypothetical protein Y1Q_0001385 [Alligator mississippiensis]
MDKASDFGSEDCRRALSPVLLFGTITSYHYGLAQPELQTVLRRWRRARRRRGRPFGGDRHPAPLGCDLRPAPRAPSRSRPDWKFTDWDIEGRRRTSLCKQGESLCDILQQR